MEKPWVSYVFGATLSTQWVYFLVPHDKNNGLGLEIPKNWPEAIGELPLEALTEINPDYIFIANAEDEAYMAELNKNSVWNSLTAVKEGHLYSIDISALSGGALAAKYGVQVVLDALSE